MQLDKKCSLLDKGHHRRVETPEGVAGSRAAAGPTQNLASQKIRWGWSFRSKHIRRARRGATVATSFCAGRRDQG